MRTFVVSDVHNQWAALLVALSAANHKDGDRLIFLGDAIDAFTGAAAETLKMFDHMTALAKDPKHIFIRGNHEEEMLRALEWKSPVVASALVWALTDEHKSWLHSTVDAHNEGEFIFVHDSIMQMVPGKIVIAGHWHHPVPIVKEGCITIASSRKVFVIDWEAMIVYDSEGERYDVSGRGNNNEKS